MLTQAMKNRVCNGMELYGGGLCFVQSSWEVSFFLAACEFIYLFILLKKFFFTSPSASWDLTLVNQLMSQDGIWPPGLSK